MAITRGSIQKQLRPGLNAVFGMEYGSIDNEHLVLFDTEHSEKNYEEEVLMAGFETAPIKPEGAPIEFDDTGEMYVNRYVHQTIALAFGITQEAMEDNLYDTLSKIKAKQLGRAMANTKQIIAANVYNLAGSQTYGDGTTLLSSSHPTRTAGNQSNTTTGDISETAIETAIINIGLLKDDRGVLIGAQAKSIHVSPQDMFSIQQILGSEFTTVNATNGSNGITNQNQINPLAISANTYLPGGWHVNHRFTTSTAWFIRTDVANGMKHMIRKPLETGMEGDWDTDVVKYKARERYSFGVSDWRGLYGSTG